MYSTRYSCKIAQSYKNISADFQVILKLHAAPLSRNRTVPCGRMGGQTDRHEELNNHFLQLREHASKATCFSLARRWLFK